MTVVTLNADQPVNTITITTDPTRIAENDQRTMRVYFDEVVNLYIPFGRALVYIAEPQLVTARDGIQSLRNPYNVNHNHIEDPIRLFIHNVRPTSLHPGNPGRTHFTFMINIVVQQRLP